jgi:hypothetical protein
MDKLANERAKAMQGATASKSDLDILLDLNRDYIRAVQTSDADIRIPRRLTFDSRPPIGGFRAFYPGKLAAADQEGTAGEPCERPMSGRACR